MAHEIESMAYFGELPWHRLGTALDEADLYDWPSASKKAGLDWEVELVPLVTSDTQAQVTHRAVRRTSDARVLGVVGPRYAPLQNKDAFAWFQPFLDAREAALHTAGSLRNDSTKWIAACLPGMGLSFDIWLQAYQESQSHGIETSLESSLTAKALLCWWQTGPGDPWIFTPKELYEALLEHVPLSERRYFPANPKSLSDHLRRDAPALRQKGVVVKTGLHKWRDGVNKRVIEVASVPLTDPDNYPDEAAGNRPLDAGRSLDPRDFRCVKA